MGRKATGTAVFANGKWWARITLGDKSRTLVPMDHVPPSASKEKARDSAERVSDEERKTGKILRAKLAGQGKAAPGETLEDWFGRWLAYRQAKGLASWRDDRGRYQTHIAKKLGPKPVDAITRRDLEELVQDLDTKVRDGEIRWKTALNVWAVVTRMFKDACRSKQIDLRMREDNPSTDIEGPDRGAERAKVFVYPSEFLAMATCKDVPMTWRRLAAVAVYLGVRAAELEALEWGDLDLEHGKANIHRAIDRDSDEDDATKAVKDEDPRSFGIEAELLPLLRQMHHETGGAGRVFPDFPRPRDLAEKLRALHAGEHEVRPELHVTDDTRINLRWHDLRASTVTWMAVRGDTAERIMQRVGHEDWPTMKKYMRTAEALAEGFGDVFPALPETVIGTPPAVSKGSESSVNRVKSAKLQRGGRDLNPRPPA